MIWQINCSKNSIFPYFLNVLFGYLKKPEQLGRAQMSRETQLASKVETTQQPAEINITESIHHQNNRHTVKVYTFFPVTFRNQNCYSIETRMSKDRYPIIEYQHLTPPMLSVLQMFKQSAGRNYLLESKFSYFDNGEFAKLDSTSN